MARERQEGAEAKVYPVTLIGIEGIIKDRIKKDYRAEQLDKTIRSQRTRKEARIIAIASEKGLRVPSVLWVGETKMAMTRINGIQLSELLNARMDDATKRSVFRQAGELLSGLHRANLTHGDYTPANLMVDSDGTVWAIDFGLADTDPSAEGRALDVLLMKRSVGKNEFAEFVNGYSAGSGALGKETLARLREIELRGRYQTRSMLTR